MPGILLAARAQAGSVGSLDCCLLNTQAGYQPVCPVSSITSAYLKRRFDLVEDWAAMAKLRHKGMWPPARFTGLDTGRRQGTSAVGEGPAKQHSGRLAPGDARQ